VPDSALKQKNIRLHVAFLDYDLAKQIVVQLHNFCNQSIMKLYVLNVTDVCVYLTWHANRNFSLPHSVCKLWPVWLYHIFSHCVINGTISVKLLNLKCVYSSTGFVVNEVLLVHVFIRVRPSSILIIIAPMFHTYLLVALTRRTKG